jgi:hypothetical protein
VKAYFASAKLAESLIDFTNIIAGEASNLNQCVVVSAVPLVSRCHGGRYSEYLYGDRNCRSEEREKYTAPTVRDEAG